MPTIMEMYSKRSGGGGSNNRLPPHTFGVADQVIIIIYFEIALSRNEIFSILPIMDFFLIHLLINFFFIKPFFPGLQKHERIPKRPVNFN